jgi:hypothetical protein
MVGEGSGKPDKQRRKDGEGCEKEGYGKQGGHCYRPRHSPLTSRDALVLSLLVVHLSSRGSFCALPRACAEATGARQPVIGMP